MMELVFYGVAFLMAIIGFTGIYVSWQNHKTWQKWMREQEAAYESKMRFSEEAAELEHNALRAKSVDQLDSEYMEAIKAMEIMAELEGDQKNDHR